MDAVTQYALDVVEGRQMAGHWVRLACQRHLRDLGRAGTSDFPYVFDSAKAERVFAFFRFCRHVKGPLAGRAIELEPWQKFIVGTLYGWVHAETGLRRFRKAYIQLASGNGKSTLLSGLGLYMLMGDGEIGPEIYAAATKTEQSKIVFGAARMMAIHSPELRKRLEPAKLRIEYPANGGVFRPLSKDDHQRGDGLAPHLAVIDEYHLHQTSEIYDVLAQSLTKRAQPLLFVITTAGFDLSSPCYAEYQYCCRVLEGIVENEEYFAYIAQLDKNDDPRNESVWVKANPLVASTDWGLRSLRTALREALDDPRKMYHFLTKNMNVWVDQREEGYMLMDKWRACEGELPDLLGRDCYVGVDLSSKIDLTSVTFEFPLEDGRFAVINHSFMPEETLQARRKQDKVPYDLWEHQGYVTATPGAVVDYRFVVSYIHEQAERNGWLIREIAVDPWNVNPFGNDLMELGYTVIQVPQRKEYLSTPTKHFREMVLARKILHDGNPVLTWAMSNARARPDSNENIMLDKKLSRQRIDPAVATILAHSRAMLQQSPRSVYEERGIIVI